MQCVTATNLHKKTNVFLYWNLYKIIPCLKCCNAEYVLYNVFVFENKHAM